MSPKTTQAMPNPLSPFKLINLVSICCATVIVGVFVTYEPGMSMQQYVVSGIAGLAVFLGAVFVLARWGDKLVHRVRKFILGDTVGEDALHGIVIVITVGLIWMLAELVIL